MVSTIKAVTFTILALKFLGWSRANINEINLTVGKPTDVAMAREMQEGPTQDGQDGDKQWGKAREGWSP